jgi:hypothetical protein
MVGVERVIKVGGAPDAEKQIFTPAARRWRGRETAFGLG